MIRAITLGSRQCYSPLNMLSSKGASALWIESAAYGCLSGRMAYSYSKKSDKQHKKTGTPPMQVKDRSEYLPGS